MVIAAYSGQPWPEPSVTLPLTPIRATAARVKSSVTFPPSATATPGTDWSANPKAAAVTV